MSMPLELRDIDYWRNRIFRTMLISSVSVGLVAYVLSMAAAVWYYNLRIALISTVVFGGLAVILVAPTLPHRARAGVVVALLYAGAIAVIPISGALAAAFLFLNSVGAAMQFRMRAVVGSILFNACLIFGGAMMGYMPITALHDTSGRVLTWLALTANFALLNTVTALSVSMLLSGLQRSFQEARAIGAALATERAHILETHELLKHEVIERRRIEQESYRMAMATEQAHDVVVITDVAGTVIYVNAAHERLTGRLRSESIGQSLRMAGGGTQYDEIWGAVDHGDVWSGQIQFTTPNGRGVDAELTVSPMRDASGEVVNYVGVLRDITREVQMEEQLRRSQKLEAIGTLAGGIAHDFNNILMSVHGFTELAKNELPEDSAAHGFLDQVLRASCRARDLVRQILTFSRQVESVRQPVLAQMMVREAMRLLRATIPTTIEIVFDAAPDAGMVFTDPTQLHQVVMNLCTNAYHAMEQNGGILTVRLTRVDVNDPVRAAHNNLRPNQEYLRISVADTGPGIDKRIADRIFDPFFTTKEPGKGTGLGLATVHGIVSALDGVIAMSSELGKGAQFDVFLPRVDMNALAEPAAVESDPLGSGERVLLVDDEAPILELGQQMLNDLGYDSLVCSRPSEALDVLRTAPNDFQVLIADQTMPGMTGTALAARVRAFAPNLPIVIISGFNEALTPEALLQCGVDAYLQKPFSRGDLARILQRALRERAAAYLR